MAISETCIVKLVVYGPPLGHTVVDNAYVIYDWVVQECEDGGTEGGVAGVKIAGLQDHFSFGVYEDEFGGKVDEGAVCCGLIKEETSTPASLGKRMAILRVLHLTWKPPKRSSQFHPGQRCLC